MLNTTYPPVNFSFTVNFFGVPENIGFQEVSGLSAEIETETVKEGGVNEYAHKLPKGVKYNNLVLKRGIVTLSPLIIWINKAIVDFSFTTKLVVISLLDEKGIPQIVWSFHDAYPVAVKVADLNAQDGRVLIETLELSYSYFSRKSI